MKDLDPVVLWQVTLEFLGPWVWLIAAIAALWLALMIVAGRRAATGRPSLARLAGLALVVALLAAAVLPWLTASGWNRINGSADWIALSLLASGIGLAAAVMVYPLCRLRGRRGHDAR